MEKMKKQFALVIAAIMLFSLLTMMSVMSKEAERKIGDPVLIPGPVLDVKIPDLLEKTDICRGVYFSTEEEFITRGPKPPDGNNIISDGDLLGPGCEVFLRNRELLQRFEIEIDLGLDAADVIDKKAKLVAFSTELDDPRGKFTAGDLLTTNGAIIPNIALLDKFEIAKADLGLDAVQIIGDIDHIGAFLDYAAGLSRDEWLKNPGLLAGMLKEYEMDIWFSTEGTGTAPMIKERRFLDGDLLSVRKGIIVVKNADLLPLSVPAGIPDRGVDFGLDAVIAGRSGETERIYYSTEILFGGKTSFTDGDVLQSGTGYVVCTNGDLINCFEPKVNFLGLDALSLEGKGELPEKEELPDLVITEVRHEYTGRAFLEDTTIYYTIRNQGEGAAGKSNTYMSGYPAGGLISSDEVLPLAPGETRTESFAPRTFSETGFDINICADGDNKIAETDETNNCERHYTLG